MKSGENVENTRKHRHRRHRARQRHVLVTGRVQLRREDAMHLAQYRRQSHANRLGARTGHHQVRRDWTIVITKSNSILSSQLIIF